MGEKGDPCIDDSDCNDINRCGFVDFFYPAPNGYVSRQIAELTGWTEEDQIAWMKLKLTRRDVRYDMELYNREAKEYSRKNKKCAELT